MAITKPLIFDEIEIQDSGGANGAQFDKNLVDTAEVTVEPTTSMVEDGQTLTDFYDLTFAVNLYDDGIASDARVYDDSSAEPTHANIVFKKATGATTLTISDVYINGSRVYDGNRVQYRLHGSKRAVQISNLIAES